MQINYKSLKISIFLSILSTLSWGQIPQLNFTLTTNETGTTRNYVARNFIIMGNGFAYTATPGQSFSARIDKTITITQPDGTVIKPDGTVILPNGTTILPDSTQILKDGTLIRPDGTTFKTNGAIINPDGTLAPNISQIVKEVWFQTTPVTSDINGRYVWKDFSTNTVSLIKYSTNGTSSEYSVGRDSVMNFNFNPAIDLSAGNISKEIFLKKSNLAQATIIGIWGSKKEVINTNRFIFALNGRQNESVLFSKSNIYPSLESGKDALSFGNDTLKSLLNQPNGTTSAKKARETSLRIASYYKSNKPNTSVWGEQQKASITLGNSFINTNINNTSTFSAALNNLEGFKGYTPELLVFAKVLSAVECNIFESYLAIKYGVTMDKSYLSGTGTTLWDYNLNKTYKNRITGYGREDLIGLNQKMATTSYQEAPYYSDSCDSYLTNNANNLSSPNRLLVMGYQPGSIMNDGQYVIFGDDNSPITPTNNSLAGYATMQRKWLVNTTKASKNWVELSYFDSLATGFASHKTDTYLIIDRSGNGDFSNVEYFLTNSTDAARSKIIFNNVTWYGKDVFTFGYKAQTQNLVKKKAVDPDVPEPEIESSVLSVYYKNLKDMSNVTVMVQLEKPSPTLILLYDISGRQIYKTDALVGKDAYYTDIKLPKTGVYIVKVITTEKEYTRKVVSVY